MIQDQWKPYHEPANKSPRSTFPNLMMYQKMIAPGKVMDLGMGVGASALHFAKRGFEVEGYDLSETAVSASRTRAAEGNIDLVLEQKDIREVMIGEGQYSLIILSNVLQFFNDHDIQMILDRVKRGLKQGGLLYLRTFSTEEPGFEVALDKHERISERTFYNKDKERYMHFFTRNEIEQCFNEFKTLLLLEGILLDIGHGEPHYHGTIEGIFQKR